MPMNEVMIYVFSTVAGLLALLHLVGGFGTLDVRQYGDILEQPTTEWSLHECRSVLASNISNNIWDTESQVRVYATRFGPYAFAAINREDQIQNDWTPEQYRESLAWDIDHYLGLRIDSASGRYRTRRGEVVDDERDLDSLLFLLSFDSKVDLINVSNPELTGVMDLKNFSVHSPDLDELKENIYLENDRGRWLKPNWIAPTGTRRFGNQAIFVSFLLRAREYDFLETSGTMAIVIKGLGNEIRLPFRIQSLGVAR
jgi:hypothetical protein